MVLLPEARPSILQSSGLPEKTNSPTAAVIPSVKAAELFVRCLENEGVEAIFGIPGEENIDILDVLLDSTIRFITTRHEQAAAFMADVYGRLTGRAGVCLATLGPGATNLVTGVADANMDHAPVVAISGQSATTRMHKESHQYLDLVNLFRPISKYCTQVIEPETIPEVVRKAFKQAQAEKPGVSFIDFPENIAKMEVDGKPPLTVQPPRPPVPPPEAIRQAADIISAAKYPLILAGNGVIRARAAEQLLALRREAEHPRGQHLHGQGRGALLASALAGGGRAAGPRLRGLRLRPGRRDHLRRLRHGRVSPQPLAPRQGPADHPHRRRAGRGGRALRRRPSRWWATSAPRWTPIAARAQPQQQFPAGLWQAIMDELSEYADDASFPAEAAAARLGLAAGVRRPVPRDLRRRRPQDVDGPDVSARAAQHVHHLQRLRGDGDRRAGGHRRQAGLSRPHRRWRSPATPAS